MDNDIKAKWVGALRSGKYAQGTDALHNHGAYCCLGVLCSVAGADMSRDLRTVPCSDDEGSREIEPTAFIDEGHYTEKEELGGLLDFFGIGPKVESTLITMNDTDKADFTQIADWIETHDLRTGRPLSSESGT